MARLGDVFPLIRNGVSIKQIDGAGGLPITRIETIANRVVDRSRMGYANIIDNDRYAEYQLQDGDTVTVIKDLKVKGASGAIKQGTKVKNIRLVEGDHNIDCKVDGFGAMKLKSEFVKKL